MKIKVLASFDGNLYACSHNHEKHLLVSSCPNVLSVCLSSCISAAHSGRISVKFCRRISVEIFQNLLRSDQSISHFTGKLSIFYGCRQSKFVKIFLYDSHNFIVENDTYLNNKHRTHCCLPFATVVKRMHRSVALC
jgi:hypothetical protein